MTTASARHSDEHAREAALSRHDSTKWILAGATAALVVALDQATKLAVDATMALHQSIPLVDGLFSLTYVRNPGAAFGILAGNVESVRVPFFLIVSAGAVAALIWFLRGLAPRRRAIAIACGAVLGGAVGNMIDRAAYGEVIDFFDVYVGAYHWPAFNVADAAITVGVLALAIDSLKSE